MRIEVRSRNKVKAFGLLLSWERKTESPLATKFEKYQSQEEKKQEANHEKIKGRENRWPMVDEQFHRVLSYCIGVIVEGRGQNEIFDPGQRNILNGKKTPGDHGQNEPHNRRTGKLCSCSSLT